jgi:flagellar biosynthesis protein FlhG
VRRRLGRGLGDLAAPLPVTGSAARRPYPAAVAARVDSSSGPDGHPSLTPRRRPVVVCVTSGKGGTGKSMLTSNLAVHLSAQGVKVMAVDADLGLANLHLLFGMRPARTLMDVIERGAALDEIAEVGPVGVRLAAGGSGLPEMADLHPERLRRLLAAMEALDEGTRIVLVDTGAGIGRATTSFLYSVEDLIVVTTPDLTAMTDAYAVIKNVVRNNPAARLMVAINRTRDVVEGLEIFGRIDRISRRFLGRSLIYLGHVLEDPRVGVSVAARIPVVLNQPASPAAACLRGVGRSLQLELTSRRPIRAPGGP